MNHLWKVVFSAKYTGIREWIDDEGVTIVANGSGEKAIKKAKKLMLGRRQFKDGDGSMRKLMKVKLIGLQQLHEIDG